jgi:uncharacterized protein
MRAYARAASEKERGGGSERQVLLRRALGCGLVSGAFVVGSVLFPVDSDTPQIEIAKATDAPEAVISPAPVPPPEPQPEPASEPQEAATVAEAAPETVPEPELAPEPVVEPSPAPEPAPADEPSTEPAAAPADPSASAAVAPDADAPAEVSDPPAPAAADPSPAPEPAPQLADALPVADPPVAPPATEPAAETAPESPILAEAATPPEPPAALEPPVADAGDVPEAAATTPALIVEEPAPEPTLELAQVTPDPAPPIEAMPEPEAAPAQTVQEVAPAPQPPAAEPPATEPPAPMPQAEGMVPGAEAAPDLPADGAPTDEAEPSDSTFQPAPGLGSKTDGVIVGRLPRIGDASTEEAPEIEVNGEEPALEADTRPIVQFATAFENIEEKPVLALVLIDPGAADLDRAGLAALPFPVSFALDPMDPATPERAAIYRAAGKEVVMLATGIAEGAQASDIEVAFQSMEQGLPEAVAVMDLAEPLFQDQRPLASLVVPVVGAQGRGLLTWDRGLNAADQVARRDDVPAAVVFRDVGGTDSAAIRRVLDRAVFKAGQDGRVAVAGTATPELVAALLEWTVEGRAATVALGPVTAVLTVE